MVPGASATMRPRDVMTQPADAAPASLRPEARRAMWRTIAKRILWLTALGVALYLVGPQLLAVFATAPRLADVAWWWFPVMLVTIFLSFASAWALTRIAVPSLSWLAAATSQLASNAASRVFPGGPMVGGALYFRMLAGAGIKPGEAGAALAAYSLISYLVLFLLPAVAALFAAFAAPVPEGLVPVAVAGLVLAVLIFVATALAVRFDGPLRLATRVADRALRRLGRFVRREWSAHPEAVLAQRDAIVEAIGPHWVKALGASTANWMFDYLTLVAALYAVGARPRMSLVLLAFASAAVLGMIPLTPGGLGFVEAGLAALLTIAGVRAGDALVATLAYRLFQFWLPIPAGGIAYLVHRHHYTIPNEAPV